ncbi:hypothetical protein [Bacillus massiliigorillae]|uniref:hypothetical protein n=1 Tax=Bacillus massiliigorillae TaxID=1243664 RepID=UPI0003A53B91|nr:hypothetical protein [Bacillus massiliigorillae]
MKNNILLLSTIVFLVSFSSIFFYLNKDIIKFKQKVTELGYIYPFEEETQFVDVKIQKSTLIINLSLNDSFAEHDVLKQYLLLEYFSYELSHVLLNNKVKDSIQISDIKIFGKANSNKYKLIRTSHNQTSFFDSESLFFVNNKQTYSSTLLIKELEQYERMMILSDEEKKILQYGKNMYNTLTLNGSYYYPKKDHAIVSELILNKCNITKDELKQIYWKDLYNTITN